MADPGALARSPIPVREPVGTVGGWLVGTGRSHAPLRVCDRTPCTKVVVRAAAGGAVAQRLDVPLGRARRDGAQRLAAAFGPGEWLVLGAPGRRDAMVADLRDATAGADDLASVIDVTHGRVLVRLTGRAAPELLARICAIDLHDRVAPDGAALRTLVAAVVTDIVRDDIAGERSYLLGCEWSSGQYLFDAVVAAGRGFGIGVDGFGGTVGV